MADGATYQEAVANAEVVIAEWLETARELGRPIPEPRRASWPTHKDALEPEVQPPDPCDESVVLPEAFFSLQDLAGLRIRSLLDTHNVIILMAKYSYPDDFDRSVAKTLCDLIESAYRQVEQGDGWALLEGYTLVERLFAREFWKGGGLVAGLERFTPEFLMRFLPEVSFGFVATKGSDVYVVIRGTRTPEEWADDASAHPQAFAPSGVPWGNSTQGFMWLYAFLEPQILNAIQKIKAGGNDLSSIYVTGHSLGAALSHLAAAGINAKFGVKPLSYTFSGPRAGDPTFAAKFVERGLKTWRMFNTEDVVPTLPPAAVLVAAPSQKAATSDVVKKLLGDFSVLSIEGYQHIGYPISATFHRRYVADNHSHTDLCAEVSAS